MDFEAEMRREFGRMCVAMEELVRSLVAESVRRWRRWRKELLSEGSRELVMQVKMRLCGDSALWV